MAFSLPVFNLRAKFWTAGHLPTTHVNDVGDVPMQLYFHSRVDVPVTPSTPSQWSPPLLVRLPVLSYFPALQDIMEYDVNPGFFYRIRWVDFAHAGFANEYVVALAEQCNADGTTPKT